MQLEGCKACSCVGGGGGGGVEASAKGRVCNHQHSAKVNPLAFSGLISPWVDTLSHLEIEEQMEAH